MRNTSLQWKASSMSEPCPQSAGFLGSKFQRVFNNITNPDSGNWGALSMGAARVNRAFRRFRSARGSLGFREIKVETHALAYSP